MYREKPVKGAPNRLVNCQRVLLRAVENVRLSPLSTSALRAVTLLTGLRYKCQITDRASLLFWKTF